MKGEDIFGTWFCHICGRERLNKDISVCSTDISDEIGTPVGTVMQHVRYCNDNPDCVEKAKTFRFASGEVKNENVAVVIADAPFERGEVVVARFGFNEGLNESYEYLFEFGYYTKHGAVVYKQGECNMQDASAFPREQIRRATNEDRLKISWYEY